MYDHQLVVAGSDPFEDGQLSRIDEAIADSWITLMDGRCFHRTSARPEKRLTPRRST